MAEPTRSSGAPTHDVLYAKPIPGRDKPRWYEIGEGWVKDNGDDMNIEILGVRLLIKRRTTKPTADRDF